MAKYVCLSVAIVFAAFLLSPQSQAVEGNFVKQPTVGIGPRRFELIGAYVDKEDAVSGGASVFVIDHDTGDVFKHSFGQGSQNSQVVTSRSKKSK